MMVETVLFGSQKVQVVDLTHVMDLDSQIFPGDPCPKREVFSEITQTGYEHYVHNISDHFFAPHADAPNHQCPDLQHKGVENWGFNMEFNRALLVDLQHHADAKVFDSISLLIKIAVAHLMPYEKLLHEVSALVVRTGSENWRLNNKPYSPEVIPHFSKEAGEYVASFDNIKVVGIDSLTVDEVVPSKPVHDVHWIFKEKLIIESLVHLEEIPEEFRNGFLLQTALLKIKGATGCPVIARGYLIK